MFNFLMSSYVHSWHIRDDMKFDPWSVKISFGIPTLLKISIIALATVSLSIVFSGTASGYFVA